MTEFPFLPNLLLQMNVLGSKQHDYQLKVFKFISYITCDYIIQSNGSPQDILEEINNSYLC